MPRAALAALLVALVSGVIAPPSAAAAGPSAPDVSIHVPRRADPGRAVAVTVRLPSRVAAVDGRILVGGAAEVLGVAPVGGTAFRPVVIDGGAAFGAHGLPAVDGRTVLHIVLVPRRAARLEVRVLIDAVATRDGVRTAVSTAERSIALIVGRGSRTSPAPRAAARPAPARAASPVRDLIVDGRIDRSDLDNVRAGWEEARERGAVCADARPADVNGDGCIDIVDVQVTSAALAGTAGARAAAGGLRSPGTHATAAAERTFTVRSALDLPDVAPGNGVCADRNGECTLRAALAEADYLSGEDRIEFDLPGVAPVLIQLGSRLPIITARNGGVTVDAFTQPGSRPNDAAVGSNAIPGVELRGNGTGAREVGFRITSGGNTIRGFALRDLWRGIVIDTAGGRGNRIVGNWIGFRRDGTPADFGQYGVLLNQGANENLIGTPALADRNVIGNVGIGIDNYGPGVDRNVVQNNVFCIRPNGLTAAQCSSGIDHNFGPKDSIIGGTGPNEHNVFGPTSLQGIELSHGWDPSKPWGSDTATTYQINGHRIVGNWVGFRGDGSYDPAFRSGQNRPRSDNGQAINIYDGTNANLVEDNFIAAVHDGIQIMAPNAQRNIVRGNLIGVSPLGQPAPLTGWGIKLRWSTRYDTLRANRIRHAALGGIGLVDYDNGGRSQAPAHNIRISRNIVTDTSGPAIDLFGRAGPDPNDPGDGDAGANTLLNTPVITSVTDSVITGTAIAGATVEVFRASRGAGQHGLPTKFLGATVVGDDRTWSLAVDLDPGDVVTALQIHPDDRTSELAENAAVQAGPGPGDLLAQDAFGRTVSDGWGSALLGGAWTLTGASGDFAVSAGSGRMTVAAAQARQARLSVGAAEVSANGRVSFDRLPVGGNAFAYVDVRATGRTSYRGTLRVSPAGTVLVQLRRSVDGAESAIADEVATGLSAAGGAWLAFRLEVVGQTLRMRVWDATTSEPAGWQTSATDSTAGLQGTGAAGLRGFVGRPVSNGPLTISFDGFEVRRS